MLCRICFLAFLLLSSLLFFPQASHAAKSYDNCIGFIDSVPATITTQGTWCLRHNLSTAITTGNAITINANNVTVDCNDFKIGGVAAGPGTYAYGIAAQERHNVTVKNCNVRGFFTGIYLQGSSGGGHVVQRNRLDNNTSVGIVVEGSGSIIERNQVFDTGEATPGNGGTTIGIYTLGSADILDNTVSGVVAPIGSNGWVTGIETVLNAGGSVSRNRVRELVKDGTGFASGIFSAQSDRITLRGNEVVGNASTAGNSVGMSCEGENDRAKDNTISGFAYPMQCGDAGGNDITP